MGAARRWIMLGLVYFCTLAFALVFQAPSPVLSLAMADLHISYSQAALFMSLFSLPGIFLSIPGGLLTSRYGVRAMGTVCLVLMAAGTALTVLGGDFFLVSLGRFIAGAGAIPLSYIISLAVISEWFLGQELGTAMGVYSTAMPVGTIICFNLLPAIGQRFGWRGAIVVSLALTLLALLAFFAFYRPAARAGAPVARHERPRSPFSLGLPIWLVGAVWMLFNASIIAFMAFAPDFFVSTGLELGYAGFLTGSIMWEALVLGPLVGLAMDRYGGREAFIVASSLGVAVVLLLVPAASLPPLLLMAMLGSLIAMVAPPVFSLPARLLAPRDLGLGLGVVATCLNAGIFLGPYLVGLARDVTGGYGASFVVMAAFALLVALAGIWLWAIRQPLLVDRRWNGGSW